MEEYDSYIIDSLIKLGSIREIRILADFYNQPLRVKQNSERKECLVLFPRGEKVAYGTKLEHLGFYAVIPEQ